MKWLIYIIVISNGLMPVEKMYAQDFSQTEIKQLITANKLSSIFQLQDSNIVSVDIRDAINDTIRIQFTSRNIPNDTTSSVYSGILYDSKFLYNGSVRHEVLEDGERVTYLGYTQRNEIDGIFVMIGSENFSIRVIEYYDGGVQEVKIDIKWGNVRSMEVSTNDEEIISYFLDGKLSHLKLLDRSGDLKSTLRIDPNGRFRSLGEYSEETVYLKDIDDHYYYLYKDSLYRTPFEFTNEVQANYIQDAINWESEITMRKGTWFIRDENDKLFFESYDVD